MTRIDHKLKLLAGPLLALTMAAAALGPAALAQSSDAKAPQAAPAHQPEPDRSNDLVKTYFLANTNQQNDANEILIALRNLLPPNTRLYLVNAHKAIVLSASPEQQAVAQKLITELDRPHHTYRLTFTLADSENGKRVGIQHISMIVTSGQRTNLKEGDKIPVATGTSGKSADAQQTQFMYIDVGLNADATLDDTPNGLQLKSKIEESSLGQPSSIAGVEEPVIRQNVLEGTTRLTPGKPITLGSVDVPGSTRHIDVEVVAEPIS